MSRPSPRSTSLAALKAHCLAAVHKSEDAPVPNQGRYALGPWLGRSIICLSLFILGAGGGWWGCAQQAVMARAQAQQVLVARIQQLEIEQQAWQRQHAAQQDVPGARQLAAEALSTLNQLQQLYQREDQLWTYLSALEDVYSQRTHYAEAATSAANHAAAERAQLRHLEQQLQRHRPPPQSESFRFSHELPPSRPLLSSSWR